MSDATDVGGSWGNVLLKGVSAVIDSQAQKSFLANEAKYNTANGVGGQAQLTGFGALAQSPVAWLIGAGVIVLVIVVALKR